MKIPQLPTFLEIWNEREHVSEISGIHLGDEMKSFYFSHLLPKSTYSQGRIDKENIVLMTLDEHDLWEHHKSAIEGNAKWEWVFMRAEELKAKYNKLTYEKF